MGKGLPVITGNSTVCTEGILRKNYQFLLYKVNDKTPLLQRMQSMYCIFVVLVYLTPTGEIKTFIL